MIENIGFCGMGANQLLTVEENLVSREDKRLLIT
jgi:hypothetical protein